MVVSFPDGVYCRTDARWPNGCASSYGQELHVQDTQCLCRWVHVDNVVANKERWHLLSKKRNITCLRSVHTAVLMVMGRSDKAGRLQLWMKWSNRLDGSY